jgi:hypothetical protein
MRQPNDLTRHAMHRCASTACAVLLFLTASASTGALARDLAAAEAAPNAAASSDETGCEKSKRQVPAARDFDFDTEAADISAQGAPQRDFDFDL